MSALSRIQMILGAIFLGAILMMIKTCQNSLTIAAFYVKSASYNALWRKLSAAASSARSGADRRRNGRVAHEICHSRIGDECPPTNCPTTERRNRSGKSCTPCPPASLGCSPCCCGARRCARPRRLVSNGGT